jgi:hypothetical protein
MIDTGFLMGQVNTLSRKHNELKRALETKETRLNDVLKLIQELESKATCLSFEEARLQKEHDSLVTCIENIKAEKLEAINLEVKVYSEKLKSKVRQELGTLQSSIAELESVKSEKFRLVEIEVTGYSEDLRAKALEALTTMIEGLRLKEVSKLREDLKALQNDLTQKGLALESQYTQKSEELEGLYIQRLEAIRLDLTQQQTELKTLRANYKNEKYRLITEAKEVIDLERQRLEIQNKEELNRIEETRLRTQAEISQNKMVVIKAFEPQIIAPYQVRIEELESEVVRLNKVMASNSKKSYAWQLEQVKAVITKQRGEYLEPIHLRIAGESESGKSHLVNQLIATGLNHFGVNCDFELYDPYPSDSQWSMTPYISEDPEKVLERLTYWTEFVESKDSVKLSKPLILICDEGDEMIRTYKANFVNCVKALWKRGRHVNLFLWLLGQNGNVKPLSPLDWSDLKNANQIYLNQVGYDFLKNGLGSRDTKALQGELDHVASLSEYYAVVQPKIGKAYTVTIPHKLFEGEISKPENVVTPGNKLICPKCNSDDVKKNGSLHGRPRMKCNNCLKQSYAD